MSRDHEDGPAGASRQRCIIVLGMHRSGTSMLTGTLEQAGLALGEVNRTAPHNQKGNRESHLIMLMHDDLLEANGGSWDRPPETVHWERRHTVVRDRIIAGFRHEAVWGFKDPRTLLTLEGWLEALPDAELVGIFRHPAMVAQSLQRRDRFAIPRSLDLWCAYNRRLASLAASHGFPVLEFGADPDRLSEKLRELVRLLDLPDQREPLTFFDNALRQQSRPAMALPDDVLDLVAKLDELAM